MFKKVFTTIALIVISCSAALALPTLERVRTGQQGQGYFRIKGTSTQVTPRGNNYVRLTTYR